MVAIGTAVGAIVASMRMRLDMATQVIPMGIVMGVLVIVMNFISNVWVAAPFLILLGGLGGFLVVPMNALLQHRGHNLMGAGRSIAVQNFNEQACILGLGAFYSLSTGMGLSAFGAITAFGAGGGRRHVADQALAPEQLREAPGRSRPPAADRAARQACMARCQSGAGAAAGARAVLNAFVWGVSWWPFRELAGHGLHPLWATALIYLVSARLAAGLQAAVPGAASRASRCCGCWWLRRA